MDDIKKGARESEVEAKEAWRKADGESVSDKVANAGDEIRKDLGNAGDDIRETVRDAGHEVDRRTDDV